MTSHPATATAGVRRLLPSWPFIAGLVVVLSVAGLFVVAPPPPDQPPRKGLLGVYDAWARWRQTGSAPGTPPTGTPSPKTAPSLPPASAAGAGTATPPTAGGLPALLPGRPVSPGRP